MASMTRRELVGALLGLGAAGVLASCSGPSPAAPVTAPTPAPKPTAAPAAPAAAPTTAPAASGNASPTRVRLGFVSPSAANSAIWAAMDGGYLQKYGVDAELVAINNSTQAVPALLAGEMPINCGLSTTEVIASALQGSDLLLIAANVNTIPSSVMASKDIGAVGDLKGKRVAVARLGSASDTAARIYLKRAGLDPTKDVTIVQAGGQNEILGAIQGGSADAGVLSPPVTMLARNAGYKELADLGQMGIEYAFNGVVTRRKTLQEQPQLVENVLKAMIEGIHRLRSDQTFGEAVITHWAQLKDATVAKDTWEEFKPYLLERPYPTVEGVKTVLTELAPQVSQAASADPKSFFDDSILRKLEASGFFSQVGVTG